MLTSTQISMLRRCDPGDSLFGLLLDRLEGRREGNLDVLEREVPA
jgi:hypothetical protein